MFGRMALGAGVVGASILIGTATMAGPASAAATCSCPIVPVTAGSSLAFAGFDATEMALAGVGALAAGGGLLLLTRRRGTVSFGLTVGGVAMAGMVLLAPFGGVADAATVSCNCPPALAAVTAPATGPGTGTGANPVTTPASGGPTPPPTSTPTPTLPESPYAALLPLAGVAVAGGLVLRSQRRRSSNPADRDRLNGTG